MSNNNIDRVFTELKALSQKKWHLLFADLERGTERLLLNEAEVDWLIKRLLTSEVEIFDYVPDTIKNGSGLKQIKKQGHLAGTFLVLKYEALKVTGRMVVLNGFGVYKDSEYKETVTSSCITVIDNKCCELM